MLWIGRPPADRDRMVLVADDLPTLVRKAESIETKVLMNLLECQSDLLAKVSLETFAKDATQRRKMAELMVQSFQLLVRQVDHVPGKTGELMTKTHTMLERPPATVRHSSSKRNVHAAQRRLRLHPTPEDMPR